MKTFVCVIMGLVVTALTTTTFGQTNLQFTAVQATDEQAIQLHWSSEPNHVYEIDAADALIDTNTGSVVWNKLRDDYPSHGTNTFWLDTGNYFITPIMPHPKNMPQRFYRIVDQGLDGLANDEPTITIVSPTNSALVTGGLTVSVAVNTDQSGPLTTTLYVDGQAMWPSADGSNYVINTCEWGNGPHTLFATAKVLSSPEGFFGAPAALIGHGVSPLVPVIFSNLITRISFSEQFFEPSLGQTQRVSAVFAANSDWTLAIKDNFGNAVRHASGSGNTMLFPWDGLGDGGTNIPAGVYHYYISAQTNGMADAAMVASDNDSSGLSFSAASRANVQLAKTVDDSAMQTWIIPADDSALPLPLALYPPGFDTNGLTIFEASTADIQSLKSTPERAARNSFTAVRTVSMAGGATPLAQFAQADQVSPPAPGRPEVVPAANAGGTVGVAYYNYGANTNGYQPALPKGSQGPNLGTIHMEGVSTPPVFSTLSSGSVATTFAYEMAIKGGWKNPESLSLANDQLTIGQLRSSGTGNPLNTADIALLVMHGVYGSDFDYNAAANCKQMYFPVPYGTSSQYIRMSEMHFGGPAPGVGLKWLVLMACSSLNQANWQTMQNQSIKPYNSNLHMILGADTEMETTQNLAQHFADYMNGDPTKNVAQLPIREAWYKAASDDYHTPIGQFHKISLMRLAVVYDQACKDDYLQVRTNTVLQGGTWGKDTQKVWPDTYP